MTSNTAPSPVVVSASSINNVAKDAFYAFNRNGITNDTWITEIYNLTGWLKVYSGGASWRVSSYTITAESADSSPRDWTLKGNDDGGSSWTTLDTRTGIVFDEGEMKTFTVSSPQEFKYYLLDITANGGSIYYVAVRELELIADVVVTICDISESNESTDSVSGYTAITADVSESSSNTDQVDGTKDFEIVDVLESSEGTDLVDVFQDFSICDIDESVASTDSITSSVGGDVDVSESSTSTDTVDALDTFIVDVLESVSSTDEVDSVNRSVDDITGTVSIIAAMSTIDITGVTDGHGNFVGTTGNCSCTSTGIVGAIGVVDVECGIATFTGGGLVDSNGSLVVEGGKCGIGVLGLVENIGSLEVSCKRTDGACVGLVDAIGGLVASSNNLSFSGSGWSDLLGVADIVTSTPTFNGSGAVENVGIMSCIAEDSIYISSGAVGSVGILSVVASFFLFKGSDIGSSTLVKAFCYNLLRKGLVSTFTNYGFNSFASINGKLIGSNSSGLFLLEGEHDVSTDIAAMIDFPLGKFGTTKTKQLRAVRLFGRSNGDLVVAANDGKSGSWEVTIPMTGDESAESLVGYFPFTTRGRYLQLSIENVNGSDFFLDQVELALYILGRA
jgi:hypothetical protein